MGETLIQLLAAHLLLPPTLTLLTASRDYGFPGFVVSGQQSFKSFKEVPLYRRETTNKRTSRQKNWLVEGDGDNSGVVFAGSVQCALSRAFTKWHLPVSLTVRKRRGRVLSRTAWTGSISCTQVTACNIRKPKFRDIRFCAIVFKILFLVN